MNTKELQLVTFKQAKRLKQLGFDLECYNYYDETQGNILCTNPLICYNDNHNGDNTYKISAPTVAHALKWFRDAKEFYTSITFYFSSGQTLYEAVFLNKGGKIDSSIEFDTYEEAESALLDKLLTVLEKE